MVVYFHYIKCQNTSQWTLVYNSIRVALSAAWFSMTHNGLDIICGDLIQGCGLSDQHWLLVGLPIACIMYSGNLYYYLFVAAEAMWTSPYKVVGESQHVFRLSCAWLHNGRLCVPWSLGLQQLFCWNHLWCGYVTPVHYCEMRAVEHDAQCHQLCCSCCTPESF